MTAPSTLDRLVAEADIRALCCRYAQALDRRNLAQLRDLFTADAVLEGTSTTFTGIDEISKLVAMMGERYIATQHALHNQIVEIDGDTATAETYCTAQHVRKNAGGGTEIYVIGVRYRDRFRRVDGAWRFTRRTVIPDWEEIRPATATPSRHGDL